MKQRLTVTFFVNAAGEKQKTIAIWKIKKKLQDLSRPANVRYFWNPKSWMTSEAMEAVMARFNRKFVFEGRKSHSFFFVKEFTTDISAAEYTNFNKNVPVSEPMINEFEMDWRQRVREDSINPIQNPEIASD